MYINQIINTITLIKTIDYLKMVFQNGIYVDNNRFENG